MSMGTILRQVLKAFNLFQLLENEPMEIFSMRVRNKSKHKFTGMKESKTVDEREYLRPKIQIKILVSV